MKNWICPRCAVYFSTSDALLEGTLDDDAPASCPDCGGEGAPAEGELT